MVLCKYPKWCFWNLFCKAYNQQNSIWIIWGDLASQMMSWHNQSTWKEQSPTSETSPPTHLALVLRTALFCVFVCPPAVLARLHSSQASTFLRGQLSVWTYGTLDCRLKYAWPEFRMTGQGWQDIQIIPHWSTVNGPVSLHCPKLRGLHVLFQHAPPS